ncbi:MAG: hypothetical protein M1838_002298 [Thelocarpon superellum]|nr:MAG: hypothetical protein M1838_002298 [Thelocarpon superellum]
MEPIVPRLQQLRRSLVDHPDGSSTPVFATSPHGAPNHVLINEYQPGQGIMPHEDGAAYFPLVATVSLGGPLVLDLYEKTVEGKREAHPRYRILQEARSLLITTDEMYTAHLHGIADIVVDEHLGPSTIANWDQLGNATIFGRGKLERVTRTSLTYRDVRKVSNLGSKLNLLSKSKR